MRLSNLFFMPDTCENGLGSTKMATLLLLDFFLCQHLLGFTGTCRAWSCCCCCCWCRCRCLVPSLAWLHG